MSLYFRLFLILILSFGAAAGTLAQEAVDASSKEIVEADVEPSFEEKILALKQTIKQKEKEQKFIQEAIGNEADELVKQRLQQELVAASEVIVGLREEIVNISTGGARLYEEPPVVKREFDWRKDLELIFEPLLDQLREISERPRLVEKLRSDIAFWESRQEELNKAVANLQKNLDSTQNDTVKKDVQALLDTATARANTADQKLSLLNNELSALEKDQSPIWTTLSDIFSNIIVSVVLHFFIAILVAFLVYQAIRFLSLIPITFIVRNNPGETVFAERAIVVVRIVIGAILALMAYFVVLYSFAEWLMLVISVFLLVGIVLALRQTLPKYFLEIKTMLNMGSIRQGERIMFNGLPWRIARLNLHTRLHNPALHGHLRVPLEELVMSSSRPYHEDEPWFPTQVGDVLFLEDGAFGRVKRQTPEIVEIDLGGSIYSYQTSDFLSRRPRNLSREGFTVYEVFGFDYQHQKDITGSMLQTYQAAMEKAIKASPFAQYNTYLGVEFDNASASSLDFKTIAAFTGEVAMDYFKIKRLLQKASVDLANEKGWVIPFQQITVHHQPVEPTQQ